MLYLPGGEGRVLFVDFDDLAGMVRPGTLPLSTLTRGWVWLDGRSWRRYVTLTIRSS